MSVAPARRCAYRVIRRVFEEGAYADRALIAEAQLLDGRDRALATRLSYGSVQRRGTLDHLVTQLSERPLERLDPHVLAALRLGLYELLFLSGAPDRAVVDDAVELTKGAGRGGHGLVNAVLRRAATEGTTLVDSLSDESPEAAAVCHSHPRWLARLWFEQLGAPAARLLMAANNEAAEAALRVNWLVADTDDLAQRLPVATRTVPGLPEALVLRGPFDAHGSPLWAQGRFMPQSRAAMLVARALEPLSGERVLDLCAAPGAKTTHLAALMQGGGEVVAVERHRGRAAALRRTCARMRADSVRVEVADARDPRAGSGGYDRVLVDPPCSGLGTLQARPDLRWRVTPQTITELSAVQAALLDAGAAALAPGGVLLYATCTISPRENELQMADFLRRRPDFEVDDLSADLGGYAHPQESSFALTLPQRDATAGFFLARLRRHC